MELLASAFDSAVLENVAIGIAGAVILKLLELTYVRVSDFLFFAFKNFSVAGVWGGEFESYILDQINVEILYVAQHKNEIKFKLQQYNNKNNQLKRFYGTGVMRGTSISAIYYSEDKESIQHGVLALTTIPNRATGKTELVGRYAELEMGSRQNRIIASEEKYILTRSRLGIIQGLRIRFGFRCFNNFNEAHLAVS